MKKDKIAWDCYDWSVETLSFFSCLLGFYPVFIGLRDSILGVGDFVGNVGAYLDGRLFCFLFILSLMFYVGLSVLQRFPHLYNYPVEVTDKNRLCLYRLGVGLVRHIKFLIVLWFGSIGLCVASTARTSFYVGMIFLGVVGMITILIVYVVKMLRLEKF